MAIGDTTYQVAMLFRRNPHVAIAPRAKLTQFLHFGMILSRIVLNRQICRIEDADIAAETLQYASAFECE